jgi:hypothetical protein
MDAVVRTVNRQWPTDMNFRSARHWTEPLYLSIKRARPVPARTNAVIGWCFKHMNCARRQLTALACTIAVKMQTWVCTDGAAVSCGGCFRRGRVSDPPLRSERHVRLQPDFLEVFCDRRVSCHIGRILVTVEVRILEQQAERLVELLPDREVQLGAVVVTQVIG